MFRIDRPHSNVGYQCVSRAMWPICASRRAARSGDPRGMSTRSLAENISERIVQLRGRRVLLDSALAEVYGVTTRRLNEQVRRNLARFPGDFLFELTRDEAANLKSHFATSRWGGRRKLPLAFTDMAQSWPRPF